MLIVTKNDIILSLLLLYRRKEWNKWEFITNLSTVLCMYHVDLVLGDFNIDFLDNTDSEQLRVMMSSHNFHQVVTTPTFMSSGTLLDHVYLTSHLNNSLLTDHTVTSVYYSDHDSVQLFLNKC